MTLQSEQELTNTKDKLAFLEKCYAQAQADSEEDSHVRELSLESLKRLINQLKEEIARYECRQPAQG